MRAEAESRLASDPLEVEVGSDNSTATKGSAAAAPEGAGHAEQGEGTIGE